MQPSERTLVERDINISATFSTISESDGLVSKGGSDRHRGQYDWRGLAMTFSLWKDVEEMKQNLIELLKGLSNRWRRSERLLNEIEVD